MWYLEERDLEYPSLRFLCTLEKAFGKMSSCFDKNQKIYDKLKVTGTLCAYHFNMSIVFCFVFLEGGVELYYYVIHCESLFTIFCAGQRKTNGWSKACVNNARGTENITPVPQELLWIVYPYLDLFLEFYWIIICIELSRYH